MFGLNARFRSQSLHCFIFSLVCGFCVYVYLYYFENDSLIKQIHDKKYYGRFLTLVERNPFTKTCLSQSHSSFLNKQVLSFTEALIALIICVAKREWEKRDLTETS